MDKQAAGQEARPPDSRWRWGAPASIAAIVAALAGIAGLTYWLAPMVIGPEVNAHAVMRRDLVHTVVASGRVESPSRVAIGAEVIGRVVEVPVAEGQAVHAGQTLIRLDDLDERAAVEQAVAALSQAEARLRQVAELTAPMAQQTLAQAQATLDNAERQFTRIKDLAAKGFVGQSQLDDSARALQVARSQAEAAKIQLKTSAPGGSDVQIAQTNLQQARASLAAAKAKLAHTRIDAPAAGVLISRSVERGDIVQPGKVLMALSPAGPTQLVVLVDERNLQYLALGQPAIGAADAYPERRFAAALAFINPGVDATRGSVEVKLNVPSPPDFLRQDMTASVEIEVARRTDALSLPIEAVRDAAGASPYVIRVTDGHIARRSVKTGIRGDTRIEIVDGLDPSDLVLAGPASSLPEGERVRPVVVPAANTPRANAAATTVRR